MIPISCSKFMSGYIDSIKIGSIRNLFYMINSISNLRNHISDASYYIDNLNSIKERISDSTTLVVKPTDFEMIDDGTRVFFSKDLTKKSFDDMKFYPINWKVYGIYFKNYMIKILILLSIV